MSCLRTASRSRFTATITSPSFVAWPPVLEAVAGGGAAPPGCRIIADPADPHHRFLVDLSNPDLTRCGVKGCSSDGEVGLGMLPEQVPRGRKALKGTNETLQAPPRVSVHRLGSAAEW